MSHNHSHYYHNSTENLKLAFFLNLGFTILNLLKVCTLIVFQLFLMLFTICKIVLRCLYLGIRSINLKKEKTTNSYMITNDFRYLK